jgi:quercetin dioxygenase-like cupin family protein
MSTIHKFSGSMNSLKWEGVEGVPVTDEGLKSITRHILVGETDGAPNYIMRYFRIDPHGHSKLERHPQEHEVIVLHGKGKVQIADKVFEVKPFDAAFIEGNELHQFSNDSTEPFGFICIIPK